MNAYLRIYNDPQWSVDEQVCALSFPDKFGINSSPGELEGLLGLQIYLWRGKHQLPPLCHEFLTSDG